jgi:multiple sugar transport system permease protein
MQRLVTRCKLGRWTANLLIYLGLIVASTVVLVPMVWLFSTALKPAGDVFLFPPELIPRVWMWQNFLDTWNSSNFPRYFFNTAFVTVFVVLGQVFTSSMAAFSFSRLRYGLRDKLFLVYLATMMIPSQVTMIPCYILINRMGWQNTYMALIVPSMFTAFGTFLLRQFFMTLPHELDEAAHIDGASYFRIYATIILPLSKTAVATLSVFAFMNTWNAFLWPLIVVDSDTMRTLTLGLVNFRGMYTADYNLIMCATVFSILPMIIAYLSAQRYFIEGVAMSAVKG